MPDRFSAADKAIITRVNKAGASFETNEHGWGFVGASDKALKLLKGLAGIQFLDLFEACDADEVSDEGLAPIVGMHDLRYLALGPGISDKGLVHVAGLSELRELRLDSARDVTDAGLQHLKKLTKLTSLSLQYTDVSGAGFDALLRLKQLKEVNLQGAPVTQEAVEGLQQALPRCKIIWDPVQAPRKAKKRQEKAPAAVASGGSQLTLRATLRGLTQKPGDAAYAADGAILAAVGAGKVLIWDSASGAKIQQLNVKRAWLWGAAFTPDAKLIASGSNGSCVFVWDTATGKEKLCLETDNQVFTAVDIDSTGRYLAGGGQNGQIYLWELPKGNLLTQFQATAGEGFSAIVFSPDGKTLASCGREASVSVWSIPSGAKKLELQGPPHKTEYDGIRDVAYSPDGASLVVAHADMQVRQWDLASGKETGALKCPKPVCAVAVHPNGQVLATASDGDTIIRLWDLASAKVIADYASSADWNAVNIAVFSPDGKTLAVNGKGGSVLLLDVRVERTH